MLNEEFLWQKPNSAFNTQQLMFIIQLLLFDFYLKIAYLFGIPRQMLSKLGL